MIAVYDVVAARGKSSATMKPITDATTELQKKKKKIEPLKLHECIITTNCYDKNY